jgi:hypothetical protein
MGTTESNREQMKRAGYSPALHRNLFVQSLLRSLERQGPLESDYRGWDSNPHSRDFKSLLPFSGLMPFLPFVI